MGLLEKALQYKNRVNSDGKKSIMDRISGPADSDVIDDDRGEKDRAVENPAASGEDILYLGDDDLVEVDAEGKPVPDSGEKRKAGGDGAAAPRAGAAERRTADAAASPALKAAAGEWDGVESALDYAAVYELSKDILHAESAEELFEVILFSVMGQIGVSSSSVMLPDPEFRDQWIIAESRGVTIDREGLSFRAGAGILHELIGRKEILDIEDFKDRAGFSEDYYAYIAIDARMLVPILYHNEVLGAIILGNKLLTEDYAEEEKQFLQAIAEYAAFSYRTIIFKGDGEAAGRSHTPDLHRMQEKIFAESVPERMRDIIREGFAEAGVASFAIFVKDETSREYVLFAVDGEDRLRLGEQQFRIAPESALVNEIAKAGNPIVYDDYQKSKQVMELFSGSQIGAMFMLSIFSYTVAGEMLGFTMVFGLSGPSNPDIVNKRILRLCDFIAPYAFIIRELECRRGSYIDSIESIFYRIEDDIRHARNLKIPLTVVLISIKNYKRFHGMFGQEKVRQMLSHFERFIRSRLSDRDFSVRFDRHKILMVLPGKDKKYAVTLANTVCTELIHAFSTREVQLLVTFLCAEFPLDGADTYSLIDAVN